MTAESTIATDVLVIGGGMAGLFAAIKAREGGAAVTLVDKGYVGRSGATMYCDSFSVFNPEWGHDLGEWMEYTAKAGEYVNNPAWTEITLKDSLDRYRELLSMGVKFKIMRSNEPAGLEEQIKASVLGEPGEPFRRGRLASGFGGPVDTLVLEGGFGWRQLPALRRSALKKGVTILDRVMIAELMKRDGGIVGAAGFHTVTGDFYLFEAKATVMCTGPGNFGGNIHIEKPMTYEGEAIAYRAGAAMSGKEFAGRLRVLADVATERPAPLSLRNRDVTVITPERWHNGAPGPLYDAEGNRVEWFPHDSTLTAAVVSGRGPIYCDMGPKGAGPAGRGGPEDKFDLGFGAIDPGQGGLYLGIARFEAFSGFSMNGGGSGIWSRDTTGATSLEGLYAAGDCYHSGAIGAWYPFMGVALRNAAVTGAVAGLSAAQHAASIEQPRIHDDEIARVKKYVYFPIDRAGGFDPQWVLQQVKSTVIPYYVSVLKQANRLEAAITLVEYLRKNNCSMLCARPRDAHGLRTAHETIGRATAVEMTLRSSLLRTESRGSHYREDYPHRDDPKWLALVKIVEKDGQMDLRRVALPESWHPDLTIPYSERYPTRHLGED